MGIIVKVIGIIKFLEEDYSVRSVKGNKEEADKDKNEMLWAKKDRESTGLHAAGRSRRMTEKSTLAMQTECYK
jgi:hypothetical protein